MADSQKYLRKWYKCNGSTYFIHFDRNYSFRRHFRHKTNTKIFPNHKNILLFLEQNPGVNVYFTLSEDVKPFIKASDGFLINMQSYANFCKTVSNSDAGKVTAFLGQNLSIKDIAISPEDSNEFIRQNATEEIIEEVFKRFDAQTQARLIRNLSSGVGNTALSKADVSELLDKVSSLDEEQLAKAITKASTSEKKVKTIVKTLSQNELKSVTGTYKHDLYKRELNNLKKLLQLEETQDIVSEIKIYEELSSYMAGQPEKIFQNWIEQNQWVFGIDYVKKYDASKIALFSDADLLMESMDGYLDLIELKRPKLKSELLVYDKSHKSYFPSGDLSAAIGQSLYYLKKLEEYKMQVEKEHKAQVIMPRVKIIAGRTANFNDEQFAALRVLNSNLNRIQVVSYDYLLSCGAQIIKSYET